MIIPDGKVLVVTLSALVVILMERPAEFTTAPVESVTLNTYGPNEPAAVGVPLKMPVLPRVTPPGMAPPETCDQV